MEAIPTEEKIKKSALGEFGLHGLEGARVDRIAKKAKINKAMIYYHYKSKENLYEAVLSDGIKAVFLRITGNIPQDKRPDEQLEVIISEFIDHIRTVDQDFVKMMLREISSGGKYFKKLMLPGVIVPVMKIVQDIILSGIKQGIFRDEILPHYSFMQTLGSVIFFNAIRITLQDTDVGKSLFPEDAFDKFKMNLIGIMKNGIMVH
jgi:TetR/AcrR family transcriptional regulator